MLVMHAHGGFGGAAYGAVPGMGSWQVGLVGNAVIMGAYLGMCLAILVPLARGHQLRSNPLGAATAAIFFTCAVHHGAHSLHMLLPSLGLEDPQGLALRSAWGWPLESWDVVGAVVAVYYWTLRRQYGSLTRGAQPFQDLRRREQQALELNDTVLQGLVVAKMALDLDQPAKADQALTASIGSASRIITELLGQPAPLARPAPQHARGRRGRPTVAGRPRHAERRSHHPEEAREEPPMNATAARTRPVRVVIVDDTHDLRELLRLALTRGGMEVVGEAGDGLAGIEAVRSERPDVVLLDLSMPVMDGLEALPSIRQLVPGAKIIVLSGFGATQMSERALATGADAYLQKGIPLKRILDHVRGLAGATDQTSPSPALTLVPAGSRAEG